MATPGLFGAWSYSDDLKFGVAIDSPFGQRVANPTEFVGRFQSLVTSIMDINITLSAAYRINEHLSIGGGPVINYLEAQLTQAINIGVNPLVGDPVADVHGSNIAPGFDIGALFQFNDSTRVGINFRSRFTTRSKPARQSRSHHYLARSARWEPPVSRSARRR